ncbi:MAG: hypothetical protein RIS36_2191 [Pseudomonadota bacterium]|jgi:hypothetical protein
MNVLALDAPSTMQGFLLGSIAFGCVVAGVFLWTKGFTSGDSVVRDLFDGNRDSEMNVVTSNNPSERLGRDQILWWIFGSLVGIGVWISCTKGGVSLAFLYGILGGGGGELARRGRHERTQRALSRRLEFYLPTAMERVVMAVGSGLDIIPALAEAAHRSEDPVSDIFRGIVSRAEGGLRVEYAIQIAAEGDSSTSVKHALMHLALAYKQGGEVIRPLKELSDATQTHYQESVEEEIARLPVRAVLPLLLTFTGLIICFLTVPVVQVGASLERFSHATK